MERQQVQIGLAALGFDPGPADGLFGPKTNAAIGAWQEANNYRATGRLTREQAEALKAAGKAAHAPMEATETSAIDEVSSNSASSSPLITEAHKAPKQAQLAEIAKKVGEVFRDCDECQEMVVVPAGSFTMGSPSSETKRDSSEGPRHRVTIAAPFAVGKYEVTWREHSGRTWRNPGYRQGEREPVVCVSWTDAKAYVHWLLRKAGKRYSLLSEAEWENAARAGRQAHVILGPQFRPTRQILTSATPTALAARAPIGRRLFQSGRFRQMDSACTTCTGTSGNGWKTASTPAMAAPRQTGVPGCREVVAAGALCAAVHGSPYRSTSAPQAAARLRPVIGATVAAFGLPAR